MQTPPGQLVTTKPKRTKTDPHAPEIGPRRVGGRYWCGYWGHTYEVVALDRRLDGWPAWRVTIRHVDGCSPGREHWHCTAWDYHRDRVISQPAPAEVA